jgi:glutathione synthase/RimK-type ligase-like ATP-grasp enzyme
MKIDQNLSEQRPLRIALLTDRRFMAKEAPEGDWYLANILRDDALLQQALLTRGVDSVRLNWSDPAVDWSEFDAAIFRTTWDYYERYDEFAPWVERVSHLTRLCNPPPMIRWNADKHYLQDLEQRGIPVVPFFMLEAGNEIPLAEVMRQQGWEQAVVKPCISGGARLTFRVSRENADQIDAEIASFRRGEAFMLQPFVPAVQITGEDSLMVFDGQYTHAVRKRPKAGDFRVQDDHGGTVSAYTPEAAQIALAVDAMRAATGGTPVYGRADMVCMSDGTWAIMELEFLEPELWLRYHPESAEVFAGSIFKWLQK